MMIRLLGLLAVCGVLVWVAISWNRDRKRRAEAFRQLEALIGRRAIVTEPVQAEKGLVRINGEAYAACTDGPAIGPRVLVEVVGIRNFRLLVRKVQGQGLLIDVDHMLEAERRAKPRPPRKE